MPLPTPARGTHQPQPTTFEGDYQRIGLATQRLYGASFGKWLMVLVLPSVSAGGKYQTLSGQAIVDDYGDLVLVGGLS